MIPWLRRFPAKLNAIGSGLVARRLFQLRKLAESTESARRALVTISEDRPASVAPESGLLSEAALAEDWSRPEEDAAWSHLQSRAWTHLTDRVTAAWLSQFSPDPQAKRTTRGTWSPTGAPAGILTLTCSTPVKMTPEN